jgi:hypothetical protein
VNVGLTAGMIYRFGIVTQNERGDSVLSYILAASTTDLPSAPTLLSKISSMSNETSLMI